MAVNARPAPTGRRARFRNVRSRRGQSAWHGCSRKRGAVERRRRALQIGAVCDAELEEWGWGLELHQRIELEARERRVGVVGRPGDEVREVALCTDRERIQELVLDADSGPLHVRS